MVTVLNINRLVCSVAIIFFLSCQISFGQHVVAIHNAVIAGDLNKVRELIEADSTLLESKDYNGNTPLITACQTMQLDIANYLIDKGANVNAKAKSDVTPLIVIRKNNDNSFELIKRLIDKGADVNAKMSLNRNWTVICTVVKKGSLKIAKLLIDHGADINIKDIEGTPLQIAILNQNEGMAKLLLENGAKLQEFSFGNTELHLVAMKGYSDLIPFLIKHGTDVNAMNDYGHSPLYYAAKHGYRKTAKVLIDAGANKNAIVETNYGKAPQLKEKLKKGEAYLWAMNGFVVKTKEHLLMFNPPFGSEESSEAALANGNLNHNELAGQKIIVFTHEFPARKLSKTIPDASFIFDSIPPSGGEGLMIVEDRPDNAPIPPHWTATPNDSFSIGKIQIHTSALHRYFAGMEGFGYLVEADGLKIFYAGLHISGKDSLQILNYYKEIDDLKAFGPIDIAILPVKDRHISPFYKSYLYLLDQLSPKVIFLEGYDLATEEHKKCFDVLKNRNIPVLYPEGGIAFGERFHFIRN